MSMRIDLSLTNLELYKDLEIETVAGRQNLKTPVPVAVSHLGTNIQTIIKAVPPDQRDAVILTGPMAVWSYLVVFHNVVHVFGKVYYDDGRTGPVLIAAHG